MRVRTSLVALSVAAVFAMAAVHAETTIEEKKKLEPGGRFSLEADGGSVTLRGTSQSGARIVVHSRRDDVRDHYDLRFEESAGAVHVTIKRKDHNVNLRGDSIHVDVEVPEKTQIDLDTSGGSLDVAKIVGNASLVTSGGSIELAEITGAVKAHTSGGSIEATSIQGTLEAESSGGHLRFSGVKGDLDATTSGGTIRIEGAEGRVSAETSGGGIEARLGANAHGGKLETSGGSVHVYLDPSVDLTLDAATSGGTVSSSLPITGTRNGDRDSMQGTIGKGGETLRIRSSGGSIRVEKL